MLLSTGCTDAESGSADGGLLDVAAQPVWRTEIAVTIGDQDREGHDFLDPAPLGEDSRGHIYVIDPPAREVRRFHRDGSFNGTVVRPGDGPGEMRFRPLSYGLVGDTVWFGEFPTGRVQFVAADGRTTRLHETGIAPYTLDDASVEFENIPAANDYWISTRTVIEESDPFRPDYIVRLSRGTHRSDMRVVHEWTEPSGSLRFHSGGTHAFFPGPRDNPIVLPLADGSSFIRIDRPFPAGGNVASIRLRRYSAGGELLQDETIATSTARIPESTRHAFEDDVIESVSMIMPPSSEDRRRLAAFVASIPDYPPAIVAANHGPDGTLWLRQSGSNDDGSQPWIILDSAFTPVARTELPANVLSLTLRPPGTLWAIVAGKLDTKYVAMILPFR